MDRPQILKSPLTLRWLAGSLWQTSLLWLAGLLWRAGLPRVGLRSSPLKLTPLSQTETSSLVMGLGKPARHSVRPAPNDYQRLIFSPLRPACRSSANSIKRLTNSL